MSSVAQMLRQAEALKASVSDSSKTISETWVMRQKLEDIYKKILLVDLEYALDKKVEQELWNHAFKNQITNLQTQAKDKQNVKRAEIQATLNLFLETASGFYLQFLQLICTTFKLDLPFRRKSAYFGIMKERTQMKLKVTPPKKSSCLYVCQHCLVHLGDIARYRQQIDQAQTYYWHAAYLVPFNGQPYNQLAILEAAKGNKLSTVFYYVRSLAVKVPFPVAATNLEKLYAKLAKETPDFKGKLSASEMITGFLQFHALVHLCTDLDKAEDLSLKLAQGLPAHVTSQSFPWQVLVQIVAINIFALNHIQQSQDMVENDMSLTNGDCDLSGDEERCFDLVFSLTVSMLDILLQYTPKQEHKVRDYFTLPAIKLLLDWLRLNPANFDRPVLRHSQLWGNMCKVLNSIQSQQTAADRENDISKYEDLPLPEDAELRCFQPIEKAQSCYSYSKIPADGIPSDVEVLLRCQRMLELGEWIITEVPSIQLSMLGGKAGKPLFKTPTPPPPQSSGKPVVSLITKTRPLPTTNTAIQGKVGSVNAPVPSPEKRSNRQNVAIQAIIQKQAQNNLDKKIKDDPASPKYLLGVPTSEPVFFKSGGGARQPTPTTNSPQGAPTGAKSTGQPAGVLVLKSQEHLSQTGKQPTKSPSWQQQQQQQQRPASSWQQGKQLSAEKMIWSNTQISPAQGQQKMGRGQLSPWQQQQQQQQQAVGLRPQLSPQTNQAQWQYPAQPNFGRGDYRPRSPTASQPIRDNRPPHHEIPNPTMQSPQGPIFPQGQNRPGFSPSQANPLGPSPNKDIPVGSPDQNFKGLMYGKMPQGQMGPAGGGLQNDRFGVPGLSNLGSGDGGPLPFSPGQLPMFRHPPPARFPPPPNFMNPPPDLGSSQSNMQAGLNSPQITPPVTGPNPFSDHGLGNQSSFSHAPGTERQRMPGPPPTQNHQQQMPMHFPQGQFMNPFTGFMGFSGMTNNQLKSPLDGLFGKPRFSQDDIPPNMADIIGTLTKMAIQPPKENIPPQRGSTAFQGHAEGTPKPESFYTPQRSSSVPTVNIDLENKVPEPLPTTTTPQSQQQPQGTYSLFSGSPWLSSGDSKSLGSSPFSSQSGSMRNSPDPGSDTFSSDGKSGQVGLDMGLRYSAAEEKKQAPGETQGSGPFFQNNMQSLWSNPAQSPLERLLELQKQQRQTEPH